MHMAEKQFINYIQKFDKQPFKMILNNKEYTIGTGEPVFTVKINKAPRISSLLKSTSITLGEAYMNGDIEIEGDLYTALCSFLSQINSFSENKLLLRKIMFPHTEKSSQKQQVSSHYDIGNNFYKLWLDDTMSYSCGYFQSSEDTLETAQYNKVHRILKKLYIKEGMSLCDIGCGWGFLLIEAAKKYRLRARA